jgi:hypothetical protein
MKQMRHSLFAWLCILFMVPFLMTGCGGGSSDSAVSDVETTAVTAGIAVDPYVVGAIFQEIDADENVVQESGPSDENGVFTFPTALTQGNQIVYHRDGMHEGLPFKGDLRRIVDLADETSLVASPFTTLVANGMTEGDVEALLATFGVDDIYADPMEGLTTANLEPMFAALAINTALSLGVDVADLPAMVTAIVAMLSDDALDGVDLQDVITTAVAVTNLLVTQVEAEIQGAAPEFDLAATLVLTVATLPAIEDIVAEVILQPAGTPVVLDDSGLVITATVAEYLAVGFEALLGTDQAVGPEFV